MDYSSLESQLEQFGQDHLLEYWEHLNEEEKQTFASEINAVDLKRVMQISAVALENREKSRSMKDDVIEPLGDDIVKRISATPTEQVNQWTDVGLREVSKGTVAVILLAGGQGTRLGVSYPKGMYSVGLPSGKTLFQLQAERIHKVQELAKEKYSTSASIRWYIMTSQATLKDTEAFFKQHNFFGLRSCDVAFFEQHLLPCLTFERKLMLSSKGSLALSPDGNGGLYRALKTRGVLESLNSHGIEHVYVYGVDNILVKVADPVFIGFCVSNNLDCGNKVIKKTDPRDSVGVVCKCEGKYKVVEYSEISATTAEKKKEDGSLLYDASNICIHYFTTQFLNDICNEHLHKMPHHIAEKKIPHVSGTSGDMVYPTEPNGMKLEKFVFDVFPFASRFGVLEGERNEDFSPLKNGPDSPLSSPVSCRRDLMRLHHSYLKKAEVEVSTENKCEISPLVSYGGEGLEKLTKRKLNVTKSTNLEPTSL